MPKVLAYKQQLNILHAEDQQEVYESCKEDILRAFDKAVLPPPMIENITICDSIFRKILEMQKRNMVYDILLLDIELRDKDVFNGVKAINVVREVSPHTKIFVLSGNIYDKLYYDKLQEYKDEGKIAGFFETGNHEEWCNELIRTVTAKNVGILHFSDMHISTEDRSDQIVSGFVESFEEKADLLIFSGDISNRGKIDEFNKAAKLMTGLCNTLEIRKSVYVPGNHDIKRDTTARTAFANFLFFRKVMEQQCGEDDDQAIQYPDVDNYADFLNTVKVFPNLRTIVCGLNSVACIEDEKFHYSYGEITAEQLKQVDEKMDKMRKMYPNYLIIGTFHHNIFEPPYYFDYYNRGDEISWIPPVKKQGLILKKCFENNMNLLLIGHSHISSSYSMVSHEYGNGKPLHILSAGLFSDKGITPLEPKLTVNYLSYQIDMSGNISDIYCQPYALKLSDGNWKKKEGYSLNVNI